MKKLGLGFLGLCVAFSASAAVDVRRPYSAMAEATKLLADGGEAATNFLFEAALAADRVGDAVKSRDLLAAFLERDGSSSLEVQRALARLCQSGASPRYYERYLKSYPRDLDALTLGLGMLDTLAK